MIRFKEFLIEGSDSKVSELVIGSYVPFSAKMWNRITGKKSIEMYGLHVTDLEGLDTIVKRIEGTKKQLPVMTKPADQWKKNFAMGSGVLTEGGVFVVVRGKNVVEFGQDIASWRDSQGRRWVDISINSSFLKRDDMVEAIEQIQLDIYREVIEKQDMDPQLQIKYGVDEKVRDMNIDPDPAKYWRSNDVMEYGNIFEVGTGKEKAAAIKMFIDRVEDELKKEKYKESIASFFLYGGGYVGNLKGLDDDLWDEILMVDTKILKVFVDKDRVAEDLWFREPYNLKSSSDFGDAELRIWKKEQKYKFPIETFDSSGDALRIINRETKKLQTLNGRIKINIATGRKFPTDY